MCQFSNLFRGSSPHARGPRIRCTGPRLRSGIIPACAGSTGWTGLVAARHKVHPRIRGVHPGIDEVKDDSQGSSPHTRGPPIDAGPTGDALGFIPAYAGSTKRRRQNFKPGKVHPRIRGVHHGHSRLRAIYRGSSPHTRGPLPGIFCAHAVGRFIPAYAGSTSRVEGSRAVQEVHPRIRGVHTTSAAHDAGAQGSSPHARGPLNYKSPR